MEDIQTHTENIDDVKITVSCNINNIYWNKIWPDIYNKYIEKCNTRISGPYTRNTNILKTDFLQSYIQSQLQLSFMDGFFNGINIDSLIEQIMDFSKY